MSERVSLARGGADFGAAVDGAGAPAAIGDFCEIERGLADTLRRRR